MNVRMNITMNVEKIKKFIYIINIKNKKYNVVETNKYIPVNLFLEENLMKNAIK